MAKNPVIGSLALVRGRARMRAPQEIIRRYKGQPWDMETPGP